VDNLLVDETGTQAVIDADLIGRRQPVELSLSGFLGTWSNANARSPGLAQINCSARTGRLMVRIYGAQAAGLEDWGEAQEVVVFAPGAASDTGTGFCAQYEFPFMLTRLQANIKGGVMVTVTYNTFNDGSGRRPYFMREFLTPAGSS
jgi:hypothetical protein